MQRNVLDKERKETENMKRKWNGLILFCAILMTMLALTGCGGKGNMDAMESDDTDGKTEEIAALSEILWGNDVSVWYMCNKVGKDEIPNYVYIMYGDGTYIGISKSNSEYTFGELSKMTDEEIITWAENKGYTKSQYGLSIFTDSTGNNPQKEVIYIPDWHFEISYGTSPYVSEVYESSYGGYKSSDGYFVCRTENASVPFELDEIGTGGILIDEAVQIESNISAVVAE